MSTLTAAAAGLGLRSRVTSPNAQSSTLVAAPPPFVGPAERHRAAAAFFEGDANVGRRDNAGLSRLTFADAVRAGFGDEQRLVPGDVPQPRQVRSQLRLAVKVHAGVKAHTSKHDRVEKLGRREVGRR
mgnify:CR=1 FL=1